MSNEAIQRLIGEVIVAGFDGTEMNDHALTLIQKHKVRNIILFSRNVQSLEQLRELTSALQRVAAEEGLGPLIICTDQENGIVRRVAPDLPGLPGNMAMGATNDRKLAREIGEATGRQLMAVGVNMNLAPVLDVNNNPNNPVIGVRSFGDNPETVAEFAVEMIEGLQEQGIIACGKHFPGHGDSHIDSHLALPVISHIRERLNRVELVPFRKAIAAGIDTIMTAHVVFPSVEPDGIPATISKRVLTELLREELGFDGVITTDCMEMNAISETIGVGEGAVQALSAGADMVMISHRLDRQEEAIHAIAEAVKTERLPLDRLQEAAGRIRALKQRRLRHSDADQPNFDDLRKEAKELQEQVASRAVTLVRGSATLLERYSKAQRVAVLMDSCRPNMVAAGSQKQSVLPEVVQAEFPANRVDVYPFSVTCDVNLASVLEDADLIIAGVHGTQNTKYIQLINELAANKKPLVVMALQSPYDVLAVPNADTVIAIYENTPWMARAAVRALKDGHFTGVLPVTVSDELRAGTGVQFHRV